MILKKAGLTLSFCAIFATTQLLAVGFGLRGQYFNNKELRGAPALIRTDPTINFVLGQRGPGFGVDDNQYSVRWSGEIEAPATGPFTFTTASDDGVRLWVNGKKIIDNWTIHGPKRDASQPVTLEAGKRYDIVLEYYENLGGSMIQLFWRLPARNADEIVPSRYLYPADSLFLSDLSWASAKNGWGPAEKDMSNGERAPGDGKPLTIGGRKFTKGLGVHPDSEIVYKLDASYEFFATFLGIDDEVGRRGSARFQVWLDGARVWQSAILEGDDQPRALVLNVTGKRELKLVTNDGRDGSGFDHSDWADAQLVPLSAVPPPPGGLPAQVTGLRAAPGNGHVSLNWNAAAGAASYNVYRGTSAGGEGPAPIANVSGLSLVNAVTNGTKYFYKVAAVNGSGVGPMSAEANATPVAPLEAPGTVTGLQAKPGNAQVALTWMPVAGAATYNVYRATTPGGQGASPIASGMATAFMNNNLANGTPYFYKVAAVNAVGMGPRSAEASATPVAPVEAPGAVTGLQAKPGNAQVALSWTAVAGAASYNIYRGTTAGGQAAAPIGTSATTSYTNTNLTNGTKYFYKVAAVNSASTGPRSAEVSATPDAPVEVPPAVTGLKATLGDAQVALSWTGVAGAASYNIYRGTTAGGQAAAPIGTSATTSYTNTNLTNGTKYFYKVAAVNSAGVGAKSAEVSATPEAPVQIPPAVTGLKAEPGNAQVMLSWTSVPTATSYNVYRGATAGGEGAAPVGTSTTASYTSTNLTNGTKYFYKVAAVNAAGTGPQSAEVSATPVAPLQIPAVVTGLTATAGDAQVALTWTAVPTAASYNIYRGTTAGGEAAAPVGTSSTASYTNTNLTNGTQYFYKVAAVNAAGTGPQSAEVNATPAAPLQIPPAVTGLTATGGDTQVALSWTVVPTATSYNVYRGTTAGGEAAAAIATGILTTAFTNITLVNGTTYFYKVKAVNAAGTGPFSNEASATPSAPPPVITPDMISAARFLRSANWGPTQATIDRVRQIGIPAYIDEQAAAPPSVFPDTLFTNIPAVEPTQEHFFQIALAGPDQLRQRVAFALHKILVVSAVKVDDAGAIVTYVRIFQNRAFGNFLDILKDVTLNPAMGHFLDMVNNKKAAGGVEPNENYSRELMQLFTIGLTMLNLDGTTQVDGLNQPIPSYSETDVNELARALTGWTYNNNLAGDPLETISKANFLLPMEPVAKYHDLGPKAFLNGTINAGGSAQQDLDQVLGILFNHPNVGPFIAKQLIQQLVTSNPSANYIRAVATAFNNDGAGVRGNMLAVVKAILTHPEAQLGTPTAGKLKEPALFMTSIIRPLGANIVDHPFISDSSEEMGQKIYYPGSVFSYFSPNFRAANILAPEFQIFTTATATSRANFVARLITGGFGADVTLDLTPFTSIAGDVAALADRVNLLFLGGQMSANLRAQIITAASATTSVNDRMRTALYLALVSNEFQVDH